MKGILTLVESKNPPVFETPMEINFTVLPRLDESFLFTSSRYGHCNTSEVKVSAVDSETGEWLLTTRNSIYRLGVIKTTSGFETKDSGKRQEFPTGMVRDVQTDKPRYDLLDGPMLKRWAELMARGAIKYGENNWRKAATPEELNRFRASALRHMYQWLEGDISEDHGAAVMFNIAGAEMVQCKLSRNGS